MSETPAIDDTARHIRNAPTLIENLRGCMTPTAAVAANVIERLLAERAATGPTRAQIEAPAAYRITDLAVTHVRPLRSQAGAATEASLRAAFMAGWGAHNIGPDEAIVWDYEVASGDREIASHACDRWLAQRDGAQAPRGETK
jgi:hypothetical protein